MLVASIAINDVSIAEGNSGTSNLVFTVSRTGDDSLSSVSVGYATANNTATAGSDYTASSGSVTIPSGSTTATISVPVLGDTTIESNEQFFVNLTGVTNATGPATTLGAKTEFSGGITPKMVAVGDLNGDGKPDLAIANSGSNNVSVRFNTTTPGSTTPTYSAKVDFATGTNPYSIVLADLNGDGKPEVITANKNANSVSVLANTTTSGATTPTFAAKTDFPTGTSPVSLSVADLNGDGKIDIAVVNSLATTASVLLNTTTGVGAVSPTFATKVDFTTGSSPEFIAVGDVNGDGKIDLATANVTAGTVSVLLNTTTIGSATPAYATKSDFVVGQTPRSVALRDLNGDGKLDLISTGVDLLSSTGGVSVLIGTTPLGSNTPTFATRTDFTTGTAIQSVAIEDLNGDARPDLVITNSNASGGVSVLNNRTVPGASSASFAPQIDFATGTNSGTVAFGDLNGDGKTDVAVSNVNGVSVLLNSTVLPNSSVTLTKTDFAVTAAASVAVADLNGDGKPDLAVANYNSAKVSVFLNTTAPGATTPTYAPKTDITTAFGPRGVAMGDLNGDGKPDLVTANAPSGNVSILFNTTTPGATTPTFAAKSDVTVGTQPFSVAIGDLNGDGKADIVVANNFSNSVSVLRNATTSGAATPSFAAGTALTSGTAPRSVTIGDLNGDGKPDLAVANISSDTISVFRNTTTTGSTTLSFAAKSDVTTGSGPDSVSIGDINGDGKLDLVSSNLGGTASVILNTTTIGGTTFAFSAKTDLTAGTSPRSVAIRDLNGDGKLDIATANQSSNNLSILRNTTTTGAATASFATKVDFATGTGAYSVAIADLNGDGKPDLAVANYSANNVSVLLSSLAAISDNQGVGTITNDDVPNSAPTAVNLSPNSLTIPENTSTTSAVNMATISVTDSDGQGTNNLSLSLGDAASFEIVGNVLRLKAGVALNFNTKSVYTVRVNVDDPTVGSTPDAFTTFTLRLSVVPQLTAFTVDDVSVTEGNSGTANLNFTVTRTGHDTFNSITLAYSTSDNSPATGAATAGSDYTAVTGTLTIPAGATTATVSVPVNGDAGFEPNEQLFVNLTGITNVIGPAPLLAAKSDFTVGTNPQAIALADLNGDGRPDFVVANAASNSISIVQNMVPPGDTTWSNSALKTDFATGAMPVSVAIGDLNGDGKPDIAVANFNSNTVSVLINTTISASITPSFLLATDFATGTNPSSVTIGDLNNDGKPDLAVTNFASNTISVLRNTTATGAVTPSFDTKSDFATATGPMAIAVGDLNGDGKIDLAAASITTNSASVLLNTTATGSATLSYAAATSFTTGSAPQAISIGDIDADGKPDLVTANRDSNNVSVLINTANAGAITPAFATKADFATGLAPRSVSIGDLNGDAKPELVIANVNSNTTSLLVNFTAPGSTVSFAAKSDFATGTSPYSASISDLNADGKPDVAVANFGAASASVLLNSTLFAAASIAPAAKTDFATGTNARSVAIGDLNGDGKPDMAVANPGSNTVSVMFNTSGAGTSTPTFGAKADFATGSVPMSVSMTDLNGDGKLDLALVNRDSNTMSVLLNTTTPGSLTPSYSAKTDFATATRPTSIASRDVNGDGKPDIAITNQLSNSASVFINTTTSGVTTPTFAARNDFLTGVDPVSVTIADFNNDFKPDLAVANLSSASVSVFTNTTSPGSSTATFSPSFSDPISGQDPISLAAGDLNGDGVIDLVTANLTASTVSVLVNITLGPGSLMFAPKIDMNVGATVNSVNLADLNGDSKPDLIISKPSGLSVWLNTTVTNGFSTSPTFAPPTELPAGTSPAFTAVGDLNSDGRPDLAIANFGSNNVSVFINQAAGITDNQGIGTIVNDDTQNLPPSAISLSPSSASLAESANTTSETVLATISVTDDGVGTNQLSLSGTDAASFDIFGTSLRLKAGVNLDFETKTSYSVRVNVDDTSVGSTPDAFVDFVLSITNVNETPTSLALSPTSIAENNLANAVVGTFTTSDPDIGDTFTYTLVAGTGSTDNAAFSITGSQLKATSPFDFETKDTYRIRVRTTDAGGLFVENEFTINVIDIAEAPTDIFISNNAVAENSPVPTTVGTLTASGSDPLTTAFALVPGALDNAKFSLVGNSVQSTEIFDYETTSFYVVRVTATGAGVTITRDITIIVLPVNEFDPQLTSPLDHSIPENTLIVANFTATDQDSPVPSFTYSVVGGADASRFTVIGNRLTFVTAPNYEAPNDANQDNNYIVQVAVSDGSRSQTSTVTVAVTNVNEAPTNLTLSNLTFAESLPAGSVVGELAATDADGPLPINFDFSAISTNDNADFEIVGTQLRTRRQFDFETPADQQLAVRVIARDGFSATSAPVTFNLTVTDAPERPVAVSQSLNTTRNNPGLPITLSGSGGSSLTYAIASPPLHGLLSGIAPNLVYVPNINYVGNDEFYFTVSNGTLTSFQAKVEIVVVGVKPTIQFLQPSSSSSEAAGTFPLVITLSVPSDIGLWIPLQVDSVNSTATVGPDFGSPTPTVFVPAGQITANVLFNVIEDVTDEPNETAIIKIGVSPEYDLGLNQSHSVTIVDNDFAPTLSLSKTSVVVSESVQTLGTTLLLSAPTSTSTTVGISLSGSATPGTDFQNTVPTSVTIPAGANSVFVPVSLLQDAALESSETIVLVFDGTSSLWPSGTTLANRTFTITLNDDDQRLVNLSQFFVNVGENVGSIALKATMFPAPTSITRVPFTRTGNAQAGGATPDYLLPLPNEIVFGVGTTEVTILATIINDTLVEPIPESFTLTLQSGNGYVVGTNSRSTVAIADNDKAALSFELSQYSKWEGDSSFSITAKLDRPVSTPFSVPVVMSIGAGSTYASSADFSFPFSNFDFAANQITSSRSFSITNDSLNEATETLSLAFASSVFSSTSLVSAGAFTSTRVLIQDNDAILSVVPDNNKSTVNEGGKAVYRFELSAPTNVDVSVPFKLSGTAVAGTHFTSPSTTSITIPKGQRTASLSITTLDDATNSATDRTLAVSLGAVSSVILSSAATTATVTIKDNDQSTVDFPSADKKNTTNISESGTGSFFRGYRDRQQSVSVELSKAVDRDVEVTLAFSGTATRDIDYKIVGLTKDKLKIAAGQTSATFTLQIIRDSAVEGDESVTMTIFGVSSPTLLPSGTKPKRSFSIVDDDKPAVTKPAAPPKSTSVPQSSPSVATPFTLAIDLNPSIGSFTPASSSDLNLPNSTIGTCSTFALCGLSGNQGPIEGASAYFDANFDLIPNFLDLNSDGIQQDTEPSEPSATTAIDGSFALSLDGFDANANDSIDLNEGRFVLFGGLDLASGLAWRIPLTSPFGLYNITPISTLVESLTRTQSLSLPDAITTATTALGIANYNLAGSNSLYEVLEKDGLSAKAYSIHTQLFSSVMSIAQLLAGASGRSLDGLGEAVFDQIALLINSPGSVLDPTQPATIESIIRSAASSQSISTLDDATISSAATVISGGTSRLAAITLTDAITGHQFLLAINKAKTITQGSMPDELFALGAGTKSITQVEAEFTGAALDAKIANVNATVSVPPAIGVNSLSLIENNSGSSVMRFSVAVLGDHDYEISTGYQTVDGSANAGSDYTSATGTLTWPAGNNDIKYIDVPILGDTVFESDEYFKILLTNPSKLVIRQSEGVGFVLNDESKTIATSTASSVNLLRYSMSAAEATVVENGVDVLLGEFAKPLTTTVQGQDNIADQLTLDFSENTFRADTIVFQGGIGIQDNFSAVAGLFDRIDYSISSVDSAALAFTPASLSLRSTVSLSGVESSILAVSEVSTLVLHVPSGIPSLIIEDADPLSPGSLRIRSEGNAFAPIVFTSPTSLVIRKASASTVVTIGTLDPAFPASNIAQHTILQLSNVVTNLAEGTRTERVKVADITLDPYAAEPRLLSLTGPQQSAFELDGLALYLKANSTLDRETQPSLTIEIDLNDANLSGTVDAIVPYTLTVENVNEAPTSLALSNNSLAENSPANSTIGTLTASDPDTGDTLAFTLPDGQGDNAAFNISGSTLRANAPLNFESLSSYSITIRVTDAGGLSRDLVTTISVVNLPEMTQPVQIGDGTAQRSLIRQLVMRFDAPIVADPGAFLVQQRRNVNGSLVLSNVTSQAVLAPIASGGVQVTITFSGSLTNGFGALADGNYQLTIDGSKVRLLSNNMQFDGNNDGAAGGDYVLGAQAADSFFALFGDSDGDRDVDAQDFGRFGTTYRHGIGSPLYNAVFDYDGDGDVDAQDYSQFGLRYRRTITFF